MRILLVDDEVELISTLAERLELRGFVVDTAASGQDALELVEKTHYDVLVVDLKMPGMGGEEVLAAARGVDPDVPVILLTGHGGDEELAQGTQGAASAFLYKPVQIEDLIQTMQRCARRPQ